jgi:polysaccharide biosynthesis/export protein
MRKIIVYILLIVSYSAFAQQIPDIDALSDDQIAVFIKDAESKGMSELQIEAAARANGYSTEDIIKVRERINRIKTNTNNSKAVPNATTREQMGELSERADIQVNVKEEVVQKIFGSDLFSNKQLDFQPNLLLPTPSDYILGPNDELSVDITGYAYQHYDIKISAEGTVKLESLSPIYLNGLTVQKAKEKINQRLQTLFAGLRNKSLNLDVTLNKVRSIKITLVGEVITPGTYSVSSLSTLFNALYVSGGPSSLGSFRDIQLLRNNKIIQHLDLYEFLLSGNLKGNLALMDQDVIFIPVSSKKITFAGEVKRPYIFELTQGETFDTALKFAGGFTQNAYADNIRITRNTQKEKELFNLNPNQSRNFLLQNGDKIEVNAILDRFTNKVEILGAVFRPGAYALGKDLVTILDLISKADGLREDAYKKRVILKRERENLDPEFIQINLEEIIKNNENYTLKREDVLIVKSITELRELRKVTIQGAINQPGEYDFVDNMHVRDLIMLAGGFKEGASKKRIEIARRLFNDESNDQTVEIIPVEIIDNITVNPKNTLKPYDHIYIRDLPNYQAQETVNIEGQINYPGQYAIKDRIERISDLIERAGGVRDYAYLKGAKFYRNGTLLAVNLESILDKKGTSADLFLEANDRLTIPKEEQIIKISGQVLNPTAVAYQQEYSFREYIAQAGGFTDSAYVKKTYVKYANGLTNRTRAFMGIKDYPNVERGMEIVVPKRNKMRLSPAERISLGAGMASLSAVLITLIRIIGL